MLRNHSFTWTPNSLNCAICGEGHHPWDGIGPHRQEARWRDEQQQDKTRENQLDEIDEMRWMLC